MIICKRCGWLIPVDCTCHWQTDELSVTRLKGVVESRHRESVARAYVSGWPVQNAPADQERPAAG
jgi:hypothetical protein